MQPLLSVWVRHKKQKSNHGGNKSTQSILSTGDSIIQIIISSTCCNNGAHPINSARGDSNSAAYNPVLSKSPFSFMILSIAQIRATTSNKAQS